MTDVPAPRSTELMAILDRLPPADRQLFREEKRRRVEQGIADSPLLDQLCALRVVRTRLAEGYQQALTSFQATLDGKTQKRVGWRRHALRKVQSEYESPMPWMHPFKRAREELQPLEDELEGAVADGRREERTCKRLTDVLARYELELPLPSPFPGPRWGPGVGQAGKG